MVWLIMMTSDEKELDSVDSTLTEELKALNAIAESIATISETEQDTELAEINSAVDATLAEQKRLDNKPIIDQMEDALDSSGMPKFGVGDKIVIERLMSILPGNHWLDTRLCIVKSVDLITGDLNLEDPELRQYMYSNFIKGPERGFRFKLAPKIGNKLNARKQRGRPKSAVPKPEKPVKVDANGNVVKGKRGRPKGIKNRPREIVAAEKKIKMQEQAAKRAAKDAKNKRK